MSRRKVFIINSVTINWEPPLAGIDSISLEIQGGVVA
jgi:hypothetical protein